MATANVRALAGWGVVVAACGNGPPAPEPIPVHVVVTSPRDQQLDVPTGSRILVSFSGAVPAGTDAAAQIVGPLGPVAVATRISGGGKTLELTSPDLAPGTRYEVDVPGATFHFTTRDVRPHAGPPRLIAFAGADPASAATIRDTATLELVFSEPLDPRSVVEGDASIELIDTTTGLTVPATLLAEGIHVALAPAAPLTAGDAYELVLGGALVDTGGEAFAATTLAFTAVDTLGSGPIAQHFRIRQPGDPMPEISRTDDANTIAIAHPLIGTASAPISPGAIDAALGDPAALGGPIAFTIPKGQRFSASGLAISLGGAVPSGLTTGEIQIELVANGGGLIEHNAFSAAPTDNTDAPLLVDLDLDVAVYASDPTGNAVLAQTLLGVQLTGIAMADDGALAIETLGTIDIGLLGLADAPSNLALDLISTTDVAPTDTQPPALLAAPTELAPDEGIELVFDEPIDLDRARAGGVTLLDAAAPVRTPIPAELESHGSVVVVRPLSPLASDHPYSVALADVADLAGNAMTAQAIALATPALAATTTPVAVLAVYPGTACALTAPTATSPGRCAGGGPNDDLYAPFTLAANERIAVAFDQPVRAASVLLGHQCGTGSVRIEHVSGDGKCIEPVAGTLLVHARDLAFVPDQPWLEGEAYRVQLVSGPDATCDPGELCGANGVAASFDPLAGAAAGGPDLVMPFVATAATTATTMIAGAAPITDVNGSGTIDPGETASDDNRAALQIAGTAGLITSATFAASDCAPDVAGVQACMYMTGAMPAQLGARRDQCTLPDGTVADTCVPVAISPQSLYSTSVTMTAAALGIGIATSTGKSVMRVRDHGAPLEAFIVDRGGTPTMVVALDLYMDAPQMSLPLSQHDLHSKPLAVALSGPVVFRSDGRIAIDLRNAADVPISVGISAPFGITGAVTLTVPAGEMHLQLLSPAQRARLP
jgi:hypothetical protein